MCGEAARRLCKGVLLGVCPVPTAAPPGSEMLGAQGKDGLLSVLPGCLQATCQPGALRRLELVRASGVKHPVAQVCCSYFTVRQVHPLLHSAAGLQLVVKTKMALAVLNTAMDQREIRQGYMALVSGKLQVNEQTWPRGHATRRSICSGTPGLVSNSSWPQGRGRVEISLDGRPAATAWQGVHLASSQRHTWVSTVILHPLTRAPCLFVSMAEVQCRPGKKTVCWSSGESNAVPLAC